MKPTTLPLLAASALLALNISSLRATEAASVPGTFEATIQERVGTDSNPDGTGGTTAALYGSKATLFYDLGAGLSYDLGGGVLRLSYAPDVARYSDWSNENYSAHRFGASAKLACGPWTFAAEDQTAYIDGSTATLASTTTVNANAIAMWRERRRQWQDRAKLQAQADLGACVMRSAASLVAYDYQTRVVPGDFAFTNRADAQAAVDLGWRQGPGSFWFAGARAGTQVQATEPLAGYQFEYSNNYWRLAAGWEGKPFEGTTVSVAAGPDFRDFTGHVDPTIFYGGRHRTSPWADAAIASKLSPTVTLSGKATQSVFMSSVGRSAYIESCLESSLSWSASPTWAWRVTGKVHRCHYYPLLRDDLESFVGAGASVKLSANVTLNIDAFRHHAWNAVPGLSEREFGRNVFTVGAAERF